MFFPLRGETGYAEAYTKLQKGLHRTLKLVPALDGQMALYKEEEADYRKGNLRLVIPPLPGCNASNDDYAAPRQFVLKDLTGSLPPFEHLRRSGFLPSTVPDNLVLPCNPFLFYSADVVVAQANFVE